MTKAEALEASILHWQENVKAETPEEARMGADTDTLCDVYYFNNCEGCPVSERTGKIYCHGSPYAAACSAYTAWLAARDEFHQCAQAEVDFLISLREVE